MSGRLEVFALEWVPDDTFPPMLDLLSVPVSASGGAGMGNSPSLASPLAGSGAGGIFLLIMFLMFYLYI